MAFISFGTLATFTFTSLLVELTPGPNMAYLAVLSATEGRSAGFAATLGVALGLLIVGIAAAAGLAALIANSQMLYEVLRWAGVLYLLWLAYKGWHGDEETSPSSAAIALSHSRYFLRGLITNLLNPKAGVFYIAILPQFVDEARSLAAQAVVLSAVYVSVATLVHSTIVLLADAARPWLEEPHRNTIMRRALSLLLAGVALWLVFTTRQISN